MGHGFRIRIRRPRLPRGGVFGGLIRVVVDATKSTLDGLAHAATQVASAADKAISEALKLPTAIIEEAERNRKKLQDIRHQANKNVARAVHDTVDAAKAVGRFVDRERLGAVDVVNASLHQKNVAASLWFAATTPLKNTNRNAFRAACESEVLAAVGSVAATVYGGPAGSAAYAAWMTYNATGGDLNAALRVGVTQGLISAATAAIGTMPAGQQAAARIALDSAIGAAQGKDKEEIARAALMSLVSAASARVGESFSADQVSQLQLSVVTGVMGGIAVAASGGDGEAVREAFLKSGGKVLVQGVRDELSDLTEAAQDRVTGFLVNAIDEKDVQSARQTYEDMKNAVADAERATKKLKERLKDISTKLARISEEEAAELSAQRTKIQEQIDEAKSRALAATARAEKQVQLIHDSLAHAHETLRVDGTKALAGGKVTKEAIDASIAKRMEELTLASNKALDQVDAQLDKALGDADKAVRAGVRALGGSRSVAVQELLTVGETADARVVANDWVVSWDADAKGLKRDAKAAVVLTFMGEGSVTSDQLDDIEFLASESAGVPAM